MLYHLYNSATKKSFYIWENMITWDKYAYVRGSYESVPICGTVNRKHILYNGKVGDTFSIF